MYEVGQPGLDAVAEIIPSARLTRDFRGQGSLCERLERALAEKVSAEDRGNVESAIGALREALKGDDAEAIRRAMGNLEQASHKIAQSMYQAASAQAGRAAPPPQDRPKGDDKGGDDVIDAEYEVKE